MLFGSAAGEPLPKAKLLASLRHGGLVILMRHASSPRMAPDAAHANVSEAFGASAAGLADGEALILQPVPQGDPTLIARIKIEEWNQLDAK
jgi:hypothetical protein